MAAVMFGTSHFFNGVLARRTQAAVVAVCSQLGGAVLFVVWLVLTLPLSGGWPPGTDMLWAVVSGLGAGGGVGVLYEGMRHCRITVVVPVTSIVSVAVPFLLSIVALGEPVEPGLLAAGMLLIPATILLSRPSRREKCDEPSAGGATAVAFGLVAGLGYAVQLFSLSRIGSPDPAAPMLVGQLVSVIPLGMILWIKADRAPVALIYRDRGRAVKATAVGVLAALAMVSYLYATREANLAPVMVAIALYPAVPVVLALVVLKERLSLTQISGLTIAAVVLPLINMTT